VAPSCKDAFLEVIPVGRIDDPIRSPGHCSWFRWGSRSSRGDS